VRRKGEGIRREEERKRERVKGEMREKEGVCRG
jgi:hypothetical protein